MAEQLIIEWSSGILRLARVDLSGHVKQLSVLENSLLNDAKAPVDEVSGIIKSWLARDQMIAGPATLVLPRDAVVLRPLQLPKAPDDEIPDLVRFQASAKSSMPIDDLALDYLPMESSGEVPGLSVMTVSCEKRRLTRMQNILESAGIEVERVTITPLAIGNFVSHFGGSQLGAKSPEMVIYQRGSEVEISIFDRQSLVFSHVVTLPETNHLKPLESALTRSIVSLEQTHPNVSLERCYLVGSSGDRPVRELLDKRFNSNVVMVSASDAFRGVQEVHGFETLIGAALTAPQANLIVDLLHPRKKQEKPDHRRFYGTVAGVAAVMIVGFGFLMFRSKTQTLQQEIDTYNDQIVSIDKILEAGKPTLKAYGHIEEWALGQVDPIVALDDLRKQFPGTDSVYLEDLRFEPQGDADFQLMFTGTAYAKNRDAINNLGDKLAQSGFEVILNPPDISPKDPDYQWNAKLTAKKRRTVPEKPVTTTKPKTQAAVADVQPQS